MDQGDAANRLRDCARASEATRAFPGMAEGTAHSVEQRREPAEDLQMLYAPAVIRLLRLKRKAIIHFLNN